MSIYGVDMGGGGGVRVLGCSEVVVGGRGVRGAGHHSSALLLCKETCVPFGAFVQRLSRVQKQILYYCSIHMCKRGTLVPLLVARCGVLSTVKQAYRGFRQQNVAIVLFQGVEDSNGPGLVTSNSVAIFFFFSDFTSCSKIVSSSTNSRDWSVRVTGRQFVEGDNFKLLYSHCD